MGVKVLVVLFWCDFSDFGCCYAGGALVLRVLFDCFCLILVGLF